MPQAALLAGMVNNPNLYDPYDHPQQAKDRRDVVIAAMAQVGFITPAQAAAATAAPLYLRPDGPVVPGGTCMAAAPDAGFFCQYAVDYLEKAGMTADRIATGGYTIRTTLDPAASAAAKAAVEANAPTRQDGVANTFAVVRPGHDGHEVVAMVANRNYGTDAAQGERATNVVADPSNVFGACSSFKIFTTAAALENGTVGFDSMLPNPGSDCFTPPNANRYTSCYPVANDGTSYPDPISLQDALATSPNVAFVGLESRTGQPAVLAMAQRLGLRDSLASNDAGGTPVTDLRTRSRRTAVQRAAVAVLPEPALVHPRRQPGQHAGDGQRRRGHRERRRGCPPNPIQSVTDRDGHPVAVAQQAREQVVAPGLAQTLAAGLSQDTISGTSAAAAGDAGWTRPDIGKTGTTKREPVGRLRRRRRRAHRLRRVVDGLRRRHPPAGDLPRHTGGPRRLRDGAFGGTVAAPPFFATTSKLLAGTPDTPVPGPDPAYLQAAPHPTVPYEVGATQDAATAAVTTAGYRPTTQPVMSTQPAGVVVGRDTPGKRGAGQRGVADGEQRPGATATR